MKRVIIFAALSLAALSTQTVSASDLNSSTELERHHHHRHGHHRSHRHGGFHGHYGSDWGSSYSSSSGGYWGSNWSNSCYSNTNDLAYHVSELRAEADAITQNGCYSQDVQDYAARLYSSADNMHNLLSSCASDELSYDTILDHFNMVSDDYEALINATDESLDGVVSSFNHLVRRIR